MIASTTKTGSSSSRPLDPINWVARDCRTSSGQGDHLVIVVDRVEVRLVARGRGDWEGRRQEIPTKKVTEVVELIPVVDLETTTTTSWCSTSAAR